jgi:hypothetical protein
MLGLPSTTIHSSFCRPRAFYNHQLPRILRERGIRDVVLISDHAIPGSDHPESISVADGGRLAIVPSVDDYGAGLASAQFNGAACVVCFAEVNTFHQRVDWCYRLHARFPEMAFVLVTCHCMMNTKRSTMLALLEGQVIEAAVLCQDCTGAEAMGPIRDSFFPQQSEHVSRGG